MATGGRELEGLVALVACRSEVTGAAVADRLTGAGARVRLGVPADPAESDAQVSATLEQFGRLDLLVHQATSSTPPVPLLDLDLDSAEATVRTEALAALALVQSACRGWMAEHGGAVVHVTTTAGLRPSPQPGLHGPVQAMLLHLTRELAVELGPGVRVNAVATALDPDQGPRPLDRPGTPDDVAAAVLFLLSPTSAWVTGQTVVVDGGAALHHKRVAP